MVAPIIIIIIIGIIGAGVVFTPVGDVIQDMLFQAGITDPNAGPILDIEEDTEESVVGGFESGIDELIGVGSELGQESIDATDFEGNPIGMTQNEAENIKDKGVDFFQAFAQLFFKGHAFIVALINGLSPVDIGIGLVSLIALLVSLFFILFHTKSMLHHWAKIVMVISFIILLFVVLGSEASL